ncbi:MAG: hypothetical protein HC838_17155, partial [Spirulinaceae cyanobacterium RM2_2_10]|nr:hypothetical protein [Spirulinaceae cyanobacterium RM2_2_10]
SAAGNVWLASQQVAEQQARWEAERREAERQEAARLEAERQEADHQARLAAEQREADPRSRLEAERQRQVEAARLAAKLRDVQARSPLDELEPSIPTPEAKPASSSRATTAVGSVASSHLRRAAHPPPQVSDGSTANDRAIAASAGAGFGLSLRLNRPHEAGSTIWHTEQSFPPRGEDE